MFQVSTTQISAITAIQLHLSKVAQFAPPRVAFVPLLTYWIQENAQSFSSQISTAQRAIIIILILSSNWEWTGLAKFPNIYSPQIILLRKPIRTKIIEPTLNFRLFESSWQRIILYEWLGRESFFMRKRKKKKKLYPITEFCFIFFNFMTTSYGKINHHKTKIRWKYDFCITLIQ
jgi:hypothetical protein